MPMSRAVGLSKEAARIAMPIFVRRTRNCRKICTSDGGRSDDEEYIGEGDRVVRGCVPRDDGMDPVLDVPGRRGEGAL